jgi:N-methylhydantoinase A
MSADQGSWRIGVDIGGTFTDGVLWDSDGAAMVVAKVSSTPSDLSQAFLEVVRRLLKSGGIEGAEVGYLAHGTTIATNAVIDRQLARTGLITTAGFRDVLEIARQVRPDPYDVFTEKPPPLVSRDLCLEVRGRIDANGRQLEPLSEVDVLAAAERLKEAGVEAVAVCLLHSYRNPEHEQRLGDLLTEALPGIPISLSSELTKEFREFPRACTAAINAGLVPIVSGYLARIQQALEGVGVRSDYRVMQSNGGVISVELARESPVRILESGPAAGVMGAAYLGRQIGEPNLISFDMGGTTAKLGLVRNGEPEMVRQFEVGRDANQSRKWFTGATGYPIMTSAVDLIEIGAGGGSVAWLDSGGMLRVGPHSAGADPGPACYGRGGTAPTITDANLVLGRLDPEFFLGGEIKLDREASARAVGHIATGLGLSLEEAAQGIIEIADAAMVRAMRVVSVQRGYDPRDFALVAFGGAGPVHAVALAAAMSIARVIVPTRPGLASAIGLLVTDLKHEYSVTRVEKTQSADPAAMEAAFARLESEGRRTLQREGVEERAMSVLRHVDIRYIGQSYELTLPVESRPVDSAEVQRLGHHFHAAHEQSYGYAEATEPTEIVNLRVTALGTVAKPGLLAGAANDGSGGPAPRSARRPIFFKNLGYVESAVVGRAGLRPGDSVAGPAAVESADSTVLVHPGWVATVDSASNLVISAVGDLEKESLAAGTRLAR